MKADAEVVDIVSKGGGGVGQVGTGEGGGAKGVTKETSALSEFVGLAGVKSGKVG